MKKTDNLSFSDIFYGVALAIVVGVMPLIVRMVMRPIPPDLAALGIIGTYHDPLTYWKSLIFGWIAATVAFYAVASFVTSGKKFDFKPFLKSTPVILSMVYLFFVLISAIFSSYTFTAWRGTYFRYEGAFMWLFYFVVFAAACAYVKDIKFVKPVLWALIFSSIIMGLIGVSQLLGHSFFATSLGSWLILGGIDGDIALAFDIANGTLFNPNTFGKYTAMVAPVLLFAAIGYEGKWCKIIKTAMLIGGGLMLVGVFASSSLGGLVGIMAAAGVTVVTYVCGLFFRQSKSGMLRLGAMFGGLTIAVVLALLFVPPLNDRVTTLLTRLQTAALAETTTAERFIFEENRVMVHQDGNTLFMLTATDEESWLTITDGTGQEVLPTSHTPSTDEEVGRYEFDVPGFRPVTVEYSEEIFRLSTIGQARPFLLMIEDERIYGLTPIGERIDSPPAAWGFDGRENWGSGRGFIWSRTFPLMLSRTIVGSGPDTFVNVFPQYDFAALQLVFNNPYMVVDKAHNLFLQTWIGTGGISAIALFGLFLHYLITTFLSIVKESGESKFSYMLRFGLLAGISAFVMSSMATDSTIGSTGVFFVLLGMGYGLNRILKTQSSSSR